MIDKMKIKLKLQSKIKSWTRWLLSVEFPISIPAFGFCTKMTKFMFVILRMHWQVALGFTQFLLYSMIQLINSSHYYYEFSINLLCIFHKKLCILLLKDKFQDDEAKDNYLCLIVYLHSLNSAI